MDKSKRFLFSLGAAASLFAAVPAAYAAPVTDFRTYRGTAATTLSGTGNTASPVLGTVDPDPTAVGITSVSSRLIGYFPQQALIAVGDKVSFTFSATFNDEATYGTAGDNFRFALYDPNTAPTNREPTNSDNAVVGTTNTQDFRGYWFGVKTGSGSPGSIRQRDTQNIDPFTNASAPVLLGTAGGSNVTFTGQVNSAGTAPVYTAELTVTKTAGGVDLSGFFSGNGGTNTFAFSDLTSANGGAPNQVVDTFGALGVLNGGATSIDQVNFSNIDVTFTAAVPEPASLALLGLGSLACLRRRRA